MDFTSVLYLLCIIFCSNWWILNNIALDACTPGIDKNIFHVDDFIIHLSADFHPYVNPIAVSVYYMLNSLVPNGLMVRGQMLLLLIL